MTKHEVTMSLTVRWTATEPGRGTLPAVTAVLSDALQNLPAAIDSATLDVYIERPGEDTGAEEDTAL